MSGLRERLEGLANKERGTLDLHLEIRAIVADYEPEWQEGSPDDDGPYWVRWSRGQFASVYYADRLGSLWFMAGATGESTDVTHWKPARLPALPERE